MYEGDAPPAERRAAALSLDRELLRELLGQEELRELLDPGALEQLEDDLQRRWRAARAAPRRASRPAARRSATYGRGGAERVLDGLDAAALLDALARERRAVARARRRGGALIAAEDAGLYRDALGVMPPGGLPEVFLRTCPTRCASCSAATRAATARSRPPRPRARYGVGPRARAARARARRASCVRGELRPGGAASADGATRVLRRLRRASLAALRDARSSRSSRRRSRASCPSLAGVDRHAAAGAGIERLREALVPLQALALPVALWEASVLPRRVPAPTRRRSSTRSARAASSSGSGRARSGARGRVALYFREDAARSARRSRRAASVAAAERRRTSAIRDALARRGRCFFFDLLDETSSCAPEELQEALWDLVWAGEVTNDAWAPLRAPRLTLAPSARPADAATPAPRRGALRQRSARTRRRASRAPAGTLVADRAALRRRRGPAQRRALAELLLERHGIVTRELVLAEGIAGGFAALYGELRALETLGLCRRGYFVEGLGGAQFALPGAVERLRAAAPGGKPAR